MKTYIPYSLLAALAATGMAYGASTAYTTPVGYETISIRAGFNYAGVRLHEAAVVAGAVTGITSTQMTDTAANFGSLLTGGANSTYIIEFENTAGTIQEVLGTAASGSNITLPDNVTSSVSVGTKYRIRKSATLASIFGATNSAGLTPGFGGPTGADVVYVPTSTGFNTYYYDGDDLTWKKTSPVVDVVAANIPLVYLDGILVFAGAPLSLTVSGEVKTKTVSTVALSGFNYIGTVYPVGATLDTAFGANTATTIHPGFGGPTGADVVYVPKAAPATGFNTYYYDGDDLTWKTTSPVADVNASTISLPSGVLFFNVGAPINLKQSAPAAYSSL